LLRKHHEASRDKTQKIRRLDGDCRLPFIYASCAAQRTLSRVPTPWTRRRTSLAGANLHRQESMLVLSIRQSERLGDKSPPLPRPGRPGQINRTSSKQCAEGDFVMLCSACCTFGSLSRGRRRKIKWTFRSGEVSLDPVPSPCATVHYREHGEGNASEMKRLVSWHSFRSSSLQVAHSSPSHALFLCWSIGAGRRVTLFTVVTTLRVVQSRSHSF
jgi:hypothetical protein